jgi:hypothetical protein
MQIPVSPDHTSSLDHGTLKCKDWLVLSGQQFQWSVKTWPLDNWPLLTTDWLTITFITLGAINQEVRCQKSHCQVIFDGQCMMSNVKWMECGEFSLTTFCHFGLHFMTLHSWPLITLTTLTMTLKFTSLTALTPCPLIHEWCKVVIVDQEWSTVPARGQWSYDLALDHSWPVHWVPYEGVPTHPWPRRGQRQWQCLRSLLLGILNRAATRWPITNQG